MTGSPIGAVKHLARFLDRLQIPYALVGSVASSLFGTPRATADADLVADLQAERVPVFLGALRDDFYVDDGAVNEAVARSGMFNVIHLESGYKVDIYVAGEQPERQTCLARRIRIPIGTEEFSVATAEDVILGKLVWFRLGGELSARQWTDTLGIFHVQKDRLDLHYMERWAAILGVGDLLVRAIDEAT